MDFEEWEPLYRKILEDFGFPREKDEAAAVVLDEALGGIRLRPEDLRPVLEGREVTVAGNGPNLPRELGKVAGVVIAADEATSVLMASGRIPEVIVTDLDGTVEDQVDANRRGAVAVVHAHGDNIPAIRKHSPKFPGKTLGTTQSRPSGRVYNFGGFTDGDRGVFLADAMGARSIRLVGFDFEHPSPKDVPAALKKRKLDWAYILIETLMTERNELAVEE